MDPSIYLLDPRIQALLVELRGQPGIFNAQRQEQAERARLGLTDAGLFETVDLRRNEADSGIEGGGNNVTFSLVMGPQGRLYRQAFMNTVSSFAGRGGLFGTDRRRSEKEGSAALDRQANAAQRGLTDYMSETLRGQGEKVTGLNKDIGGIKFDIAEKEAERKRQADRDAAQAAADNRAAAPSGPVASPGVGRMWTGSVAPNLASLSRSWGIPASQIRTRPPSARPGAPQRWEAYTYR